MAEPRYRERRTAHAPRRHDTGSDRADVRRRAVVRRPKRRSRGPLILGAAVMLLLAAGFFAIASPRADAGPSQCLSCHTDLPETAGFSHSAHAEGRSCVQCHATGDHGPGLQVRVRLGLASAGDAAVDATDLSRVPVGGTPSQLKGHRPVVCSRCHDMRSMDCSACHETPKPAHYRAKCTACHAPSRPFTEPRLTHPTFGAHTSATASCDACHTSKKGAPKPACRTCHQNSCGKGVTTAAGCLECHKTGSTDRWVSLP